MIEGLFSILELAVKIFFILLVTDVVGLAIIESIKAIVGKHKRNNQ